MTKANLIEEVSHLMSMTREDSEVIGEAIFERIVRSLCPGNKIQIRASAASALASTRPGKFPTPRLAHGSRCPLSRFPILSRARD
jgi:integration host factor subunit beta